MRRAGVAQIGLHAIVLQVLGIKSAQFVLGHAARVKSLASKLGNSHDCVTRRATTRAVR